VNAENRTPSIEQIQQTPETPPAQPKRPTVLSLHDASLELYDVALRTRELTTALLLADAHMDSALLIKVHLLQLITEQAIRKAEGAL
jgi:hypothetical protein